MRCVLPIAWRSVKDMELAPPAPGLLKSFARTELVLACVPERNASHSSASEEIKQIWIRQRRTNLIGGLRQSICRIHQRSPRNIPTFIGPISCVTACTIWNAQPTVDLRFREHFMQVDESRGDVKALTEPGNENYSALLCRSLPNDYSSRAYRSS